MNIFRPFATDAEKNTIWDSTYEESLQSSDASNETKGTTMTAESKTLEIIHEASNSKSSSSITLTEKTVSFQVEAKTSENKIVKLIRSNSESLITTQTPKQLTTSSKSYPISTDLGFSLINKSNLVNDENQKPIINPVIASKLEHLTKTRFCENIKVNNENQPPIVTGYHDNSYREQKVIRRTPFKAIREDTMYITMEDQRILGDNLKEESKVDEIFLDIIAPPISTISQTETPSVLEILRNKTIEREAKILEDTREAAEKFNDIIAPPILTNSHTETPSILEMIRNKNKSLTQNFTETIQFKPGNFLSSTLNCPKPLKTDSNIQEMDMDISLASNRADSREKLENASYLKYEDSCGMHTTNCTEELLKPIEEFTPKLPEPINNTLRRDLGQLPKDKLLDKSDLNISNCNQSFSTLESFDISTDGKKGDSKASVTEVVDELIKSITMDIDDKLDGCTMKTEDFSALTIPIEESIAVILIDKNWPSAVKNDISGELSKKT